MFHVLARIKLCSFSFSLSSLMYHTFLFLLSPSVVSSWFSRPSFYSTESLGAQSSSSSNLKERFNPRTGGDLSGYPDRFVWVPGRLRPGLPLGWNFHLRLQVSQQLSFPYALFSCLWSCISLAESFDHVSFFDDFCPDAVQYVIYLPCPLADLKAWNCCGKRLRMRMWWHDNRLTKIFFKGSVKG